MYGGGDMLDVKDKIAELIFVWKNDKKPLEVARLAYIIHLESCDKLPSGILQVLHSLMIMEADDCMILDDDEIEVLIQTLTSFMHT